MFERGLTRPEAPRKRAKNRFSPNAQKRHESALSMTDGEEKTSLASEQALALAMARHPRLGAASCAAALQADTLALIFGFVQAAHQELVATKRIASIHVRAGDLIDRIEIRYSDGTSPTVATAASGCDPCASSQEKSSRVSAAARATLSTQSTSPPAAAWWRSRAGSTGAPLSPTRSPLASSSMASCATWLQTGRGCVRSAVSR